jgi:hypothetical protein
LNEHLIDWAGTIGAVAGIILGLGVIWLKGIKPVWGNGRHVVDTGKDFNRKLDWITAQMVSNGGSTVKDQITRVETEVKGFTLRFEEFATRVLGDSTAALKAAEEAKLAASTAAEKFESRSLTLDKRLVAIEQHLKPTGLPLAVTIQQDGPVEVPIVPEEGGA